MELDKTTQALLYLMRCALRGVPPEPIPELDYDALYTLSSFHSVAAMTAMALESGGLLTEEYTTAENIKQWRETRAKAVRKNILLDAERSEILAYLDSQGVWYLPLKGAILKDLYPRMGMRQMADNDILFDTAYQHQLKAYMESRGYETVDFAKNHHDVYEKPPVYNFEFHTSLFDEYANPQWAAYYGNVKPRLRKDPDNGYGYHFSDEDFYIYILAHAYKHYAIGGTGVRFLSDVYVLLSQKAEKLDWGYINRELQVLGIQGFEAMSRASAMKVFGDDRNTLTQEENDFLCFLLGSGTYGTTENRVNGELSDMRTADGTLTGWAKLRYVVRRLFPDRKFMKQYAPFCRKHEWAIPFFWIERLVKAALFRRKNIQAECRAVKKAK